MKWQNAKISYGKSKELFDAFSQGETFSCPAEFVELRNAISRLYYDVKSKIDPNDRAFGYKIDSNFGLELYVMLRDKYQLSTRQTGNASFWRFLSLCVVPEIVMERCGQDHPDKVWKKPRRIWLFTIWWFAHLCWNEDEKQTSDIQQGLSTDFILQLVDRIGGNGYRLQLCRTLMKTINDKNLKDTDFFRKLMVLNTAWLQSIEPALYKDHENGYVNALIDHVASQIICKETNHA